MNSGSCLNTAREYVKILSMYLKVGFFKFKKVIMILYFKGNPSIYFKKIKGGVLNYRAIF